MTTPEEFADNGNISFRGPVSGVTVHAHMRSGPHGLTEYPLDLTVAVELMFLFAEQARRGPEQEPLRITPQSVLEHLKSIGIRSGNGSRLVGRDAVYESFARMRDKGYIRRLYETDAETGQRTGVAYEFYDWPAWNPDAPTIANPSTEAASSQVGATSGNAGSGNAGSRPGERTKSRSSQVKSISGNAGSGIAGSRETSQVGTTSGNAGSPPLPPGGGGGSSPYPLHDDARPHPQPEEEVAFGDKEIEAAIALLQELPDPWVIGEEHAERIAPKLLAQMRRKEWPAFLETDHKALTACLTANPGGINNHVSILETKRIPNLPAYGRVAARTSAGRAEPEPGRCPRHPAFKEGDCSPCRIAERERTQRGKSDPGPVDGPGLLARLRAGKPAN